jgi:hypothetical protein
MVEEGARRTLLDSAPRRIAPGGAAVREGAAWPRRTRRGGQRPTGIRGGAVAHISSTSSAVRP